MSVLPLFTTDIYDSLGVRWASALIAFLALAFAPVPMYVTPSNCTRGQSRIMLINQGVLRVGRQDQAIK
jgi:hypothetical protein